jgi:PAS domain S-box-containing protein
MNLANRAVPRTMAQDDARSPKPLSKIQRYGLAVLSVSVALGVALLLDRLHFRGLVSPFLLALAVAAWYGGTGPAVLALLLSCISFAYFFLGPVHTLLIAFASFASLVIWFCIVRRRVERTLRRSEAYLAEGEHLSHTGSFGWDVSSGKIYWSQEAFRIFEYDPPTEPTLELVLHRIHPEDRTKVEKLIDRVSEERKDFDFEHRLLMPDGSVKYLRVVGRPSNDASGNLEFVGAVTDITERKSAEEELHQNEVSLREAQAQLAHVSRVTTMGELAGSIAHEVNQPLAGVLTNAHASLRWLAVDSPNLAEARDGIHRIIRDGERASAVVMRMRALFKKAPAAKGPVDINEIIQEVLTLAQTELQREGVSLRTQFADNLPIVIGDKIQLQQVILNLVINGIEAMSRVDEGSRELCVVSRNPTQGGPDQKTIEENASRNPESSLLLVEVRDSGPGLNATEMEHVFQTFYTTKPQGMGMGLAISRSIIEAHHGRLWATANTPRGAVFRFALPIDDE